MTRGTVDRRFLRASNSEEKTMATTSEISNQVTVLTDSARNLSVHEWKLSSHDVGGEWAESSWSITKRVLAGGRQDGVEVIEVNNGLLTFTVVPTRGFQVWAANAGDVGMGFARERDCSSKVRESGGARRAWMAERVRRDGIPLRSGIVRSAM